MNKEIISTMARLHDEVHDLDKAINNMKDIMDRRNAQERIRMVRVILDQINKKIEAQIMNDRVL
jgi:hypothetical protein